MKTNTVILTTIAFLAVTYSAPASEPILEWRFDGDSSPGAWTPQFGTPADGPQSPRYPGFNNSNKGMSFTGHESAIEVKDHQRGGFTNIRFGNGDTFGFETWVKLKSLRKGNVSYLIGKGRHINHGEIFPETNQNYAVRLQETGNGAQFGFLFTSKHPETGEFSWHRWWSKQPVPSTGWHHIALQYTFGKADSLQAWIDGKPVSGQWDLDGETDLPPVQDADDLVIGTGYTHAPSSSFNGWLDNLAIYRDGFDSAVIAERYQYIPPPPAVTREMVPAGKVLVQISEKGVPRSNSWPDEPEVTETYLEEAFGLFEVPHKYISTGVRADRPIPTHIRASAVVKLPEGKHRLLLRGRGHTRLFIDGNEILNNGPRNLDSSGHTPLAVQDNYLDLGPDFRFVPPGNRDAWREFETPGGEHFVILETMLGAVKGNQELRPELGETVAAISLEGSEYWSLLSPGNRHIAYNDASWETYTAERRKWLNQVNAIARANCREDHSDYWNSRRKAGTEWLAKTEPVIVPELIDGYPANNEIDHFIAARIAAVDHAAKQSQHSQIDYFKEIRPLLEARCYDCHQGGKAQGNLRLDNHANVLTGGDSQEPAVTPGNADSSAIVDRITSTDEGVVMPPKGDPLSEKEIALLKQWINDGAVWPQFNVKTFTPTSLADDLVFLRRVTLDTVGVTPTEGEIDTFLKDSPQTRRANAINRLLNDDRWADHWMGYWLDALAENPNMINPTLNNTGPFRWWLYESLLDNKPADLFVTELIRMEGSERFGGPAGFRTASQNDLPMAAKGIIISSAFLGVEMKCARCHDAPAHISQQEDLIQLAALLKQGTIQLPKSSSVPLDQLHQTNREPLIEVTLKPGAKIEPAWPFERYCEESIADALAEHPENSRDRLAALITAPQNERFADVMVNRIWERFMGRGLMKNLSDWEKGEPSHPQLLRWLARQFVASGYNIKTITRLILNSHAYQRATDYSLTETSPLYISPAPRRLTAEQIVDSVFHATGTPFDLEEVSLDIDSVREIRNSISLGKPRRSWMLASESNERDRPSLGLPRMTAVASVLKAFDWRGARQDPRSQRDTEPNILQPAILSNGVMSIWLTRLSDRHGMTQLAMEDQPLEQLIDRMFLQLLTRKPTAVEKEHYISFLSEGYNTRVIPESDRVYPTLGKREPERYVSWSNHVDGPANALAQQKELAARRGDPATNALQTDWRLRMEDALWAILNSPEWIYSP